MNKPLVTTTDIFAEINEALGVFNDTPMTMLEYLELCKTDKLAHALAPERILSAIGKPKIIDTSKDPKLSRIHFNRTIKVYDAFEDFYGIENSIQSIVQFFTHAAQGLEERKQMLYLLGPVGSSKSSLAERLKTLMEKEPIYVLTANGQLSPIYESPLNLFATDAAIEKVSKKYHIPRSNFTGIMSPWAVKRLREFGNDVSKFTVTKVHPSKLRQIGVSKIEPGDDNNVDISNMVGKIDIRLLEKYSQNDPDAYSFSGGLNVTTQGLVEFVEAFKAPIKMLHPLLTATQERNYLGTENIGAIPYAGIILLHSNEEEFGVFKSNKKNEAIIDRIYPVKVPYTLRYDEEIRIYEKLIANSDLKDAPLAPHTLEMLGRFAVLSRLTKHPNSDLFSKMRVYNGEYIKDKDPNVKTMQEYQDAAGQDEGMSGISTRFAFKVLARVFNYDAMEISADPVHLILQLEAAIKREQFPKEKEDFYLDLIKGKLVPKFAEFIGDEIQKAYLEAYDDFGQNLYERYIDWAEAWLDDQDFKDPDTGQMMSRDLLDRECSKIEKPSGIGNPKDFRNEVRVWTLRVKAKNEGKMPRWNEYQKIRDVIEKRMFSQVEDLLPIISFGAKRDEETAKKHSEYVQRMKNRGYTERQVQRLTEWFIRMQKAG